MPTQKDCGAEPQVVWGWQLLLIGAVCPVNSIGEQHICLLPLLKAIIYTRSLKLNSSFSCL